MGMTGHIVFDAYDPDLPATMSPTIINDVIRGDIGFDNLLMSDDLDMNALSGDSASRAEACIVAGCDIALNCWGRMDEMVQIANRLPDMGPPALERLGRAMGTVGPVEYADDKLAALLDKRDQLIAIGEDRIDSKLTRAATGAA
jgi:beta-N-acetylhexosaminidase